MLNSIDHEIKPLTKTKILTKNKDFDALYTQMVCLSC